MNAPTEVNATAWVLPTSTTSGLSLPDSEVVSLSTRPSQTCSSMTRSVPSWAFSNSVSR